MSWVLAPELASTPERAQAPSVLQKSEYVYRRLFIEDIPKVQVSVSKSIFGANPRGGSKFFSLTTPFIFQKWKFQLLEMPSFKNGF